MFRRLRKLTSLTKSVAYTIGTVHVVTYYVADVTLTKGPSMSPEINESGSIVFYVSPYLLSKIRQNQDLYLKNDVIISISPINPNKRICKRIIAISGETIHNTNIPPGHVWIQGDNKKNSLDSRHYGAISSGLIQGKVFLVISRENGIKLI